MDLYELVENAKRINKEKCESSFYSFCKNAFIVLHNGEKWVDNWHLQYICGILQVEVERIAEKKPKFELNEKLNEFGFTHSKNLLINVCPRSLKSFITSVCLPAWAWINYPQLKFICTSHTASLAIDLSVMCRKIIESDWYQKLWADNFQLTQDQNAKGKFINSCGGVRQSTSTGGSITGSGADIIIVDDNIDRTKANSLVERKNALDFFRKTLPSRLNRPKIGIFIIIEQRTHEEDLSGYIIEKRIDKYNHICLPVELTSDVKPTILNEKYINGLFFHNFFDELVLSDLKQSFESKAEYTGQYLQKPAPEEGNIIKAAWFEIVDSYPENLVWDFWVDGAYTKKTANDPTGILCTGYHDKVLYVRNNVDKWLEMPELLAFLPIHVNEHGYSQRSKVFIEPKASGKTMKQLLIANTRLNACEIDTPLLGQSKEEKVFLTSPIMQSGRVKLIRGNWNDAFLNQLKSFPFDKHDESVDNLSYAIDYYFNKKKQLKAF